ncbi:hypothetical protein [Mycolicibacterium fluoranthenivorans]|uniref:Uncharacterized protein n=1 Tax=Mycolicibacterium fluoranthenivorans TaxID=258505 RepID=A0A7X5U1C3_9MYCO|nr:hypothetical protein [Mycolicibacterium fluoranthenivorans]MCV7354812.1 hypothetical protein [Mycolicibacterium fluoranthenivorans]NIH96601.1 hypothetical protein [Mycolicibacterium fluoranthenivorans]
MDVTTDVLIAGSMRAAQVRRVVERGEAISMNRSAKSPVLLVWHNSGNPAVASADRWVVAVTGEKASARSVLCTAMAEAALRDAAVMVLTPAPWDPDDYVSALGYVEAAEQPEVWAIPRPDNLAALILQQPSVDHLIVTTADDAVLVDALLGNAELAAMRARFELLVLPRSFERRRTHESSGGIEIPSSADYLVAAAAPGYRLGASGLE